MSSLVELLAACDGTCDYSRFQPLQVHAGKTMGIIGYGDIGKACGRLARAFQMRVVAFRRRPEMSEADRAEGVLARAYGPGEYTDMVAACDYIVMATPATPETHKLFSAEAVAAMQPHAVFVNVGRGTCVDEEALIAALQAGATSPVIFCVTRTESEMPVTLCQRS